jgi:hypothetical protein
MTMTDIMAKFDFPREAVTSDDLDAPEYHVRARNPRGTSIKPAHHLAAPQSGEEVLSHADHLDQALALVANLGQEDGTLFAVLPHCCFNNERRDLSLREAVAVAVAAAIYPRHRDGRQVR